MVANYAKTNSSIQALPYITSAQKSSLTAVIETIENLPIDVTVNAEAIIGAYRLQLNDT